MNHFVYTTYNPNNKKFYIGRHSTENINDGYQGSGLWVKRSLRKGNKLQTKILEYAKDEHDLLSLEEKYIEKYFDNPKNTNAKRASYGMLSKDMIGEKNPMYGTKRPDYVKESVSKANKGKKHTKEHIEKTRKPGKLNGMYGVRRMSSDNPNWKGGITKDRAAYMRERRRKLKEKNR